MAQCSGVTPGGVEALTCLQQHSGSLRPACRKAVSAISHEIKSSSAAPGPFLQPATTAKSTATAAPTRRTARRGEIRLPERFHGAVLGCHARKGCCPQPPAAEQCQELSPSCQQAVAAIGGQVRRHGATATGLAATQDDVRGADAHVHAAREESMIVRQVMRAGF